MPVEPDWAGLSYGRDCGAIDVILSERLTLPLPGAKLIPLESESEQDEALRQARASGVSVLPVVTINAPDPDRLAGDPLADPARRLRLVGELMDFVRAQSSPGLCLSPERGIEVAAPAVADFLTEASRSLSAAGLQSCVILRGDGALWRDAGITSAADIVVLQAFRQPQEPADLAPQGWFTALVKEAQARIDPGRLVVGLGAFGQDWVSGAAGPERIPFAEAMRLAARNHGRITLGPGALTTRVRLTDGGGALHDIRLLDAVSAFNQRVALEALGVRSLAVFSLGHEDPGIWTALRAAPDSVARALGPVALEDYVGYEGEGPLFRVIEEAAPGRRVLVRDPGSGLIRAQAWSQVPRPYTLERVGIGREKQVVLTFDDGPSAEHTPQILDILREKGVPAVFFLVGSNVLKVPEVARTMVADGHEIGSHTFLHPDITRTSPLRRHLELSAMQRLIVSVTGHETLLFRSPYGRGRGPLTAAQARPFPAIVRDGYIAFGSTVVPPDWLSTDPARIARSVREQLTPSSADVIVLHDGGGDRTATVGALPMIIDTLRAQGYQFTSVSGLLGVDRAVVMPPRQDLRALLDETSFRFLGGMGHALRWMFWLAIGLGAFRSIAILILALMRRHYPADPGLPPFQPSVTVVIPAFNEAEVILDGIAGALASVYPGLKVIVVDDGSTDGTSDRVRNAYGDDPRVLLLRQQNGGKWRALDTAYAHVDTEVVVAVDADTVILPDAIGKLVRAFRDPKVGAVAGKVQVGNPRGLLQKLQALEYLTSQNIERRAAETLNGILVVPGAIGAWRAEAVHKAGLYVNQTVTEDADLTISVLRAGYRIVFEDTAVCITEAPHSLRHFMRQRLRWTFGMMQTAWKHRAAAREGWVVGWVSLPDLWLFGVGLSLLGPIADLVFLGAVIDTGVNLALGRPVPLGSTSALYMASYLALPLIEICAAGLAFAFERRRPTLMLLMPFQRLIYRPLLYITVYRATWRALTGRLAGWGKFRHRGFARLPK